MKLNISTKVIIRPEQRRADGTNVVYLRITKERKARYMATGLFAEAADLSRDRKKIKNHQLIDQAEAIHRRARQIIMDHAAEFAMLDATGIVERLAHYITTGERFRLDFFDYAARAIERLPIAYTTRKNYVTALDTFERYMGGRRDIGDITNAIIADYASALRAEGKAAGSVNMYIEKVLYIYRRAQREYNDDFRTPIPRQLRFELLRHKHESAAARAISRDEVQRIIDVKLKDGSGIALARDMFVISFFLCGINFKDICTAKAPQDGVLKFRRSKIAEKAGAAADMELTIPEPLRAVINKYKDKKGIYFTNVTDKTEAGVVVARNAMAANIRLLAARLGFPFTFYSARHTFATIARNDLRVDKSTLDECLTHIGSHRMTDVYIKRDYSAVNEVCAAVAALFNFDRYNGTEL